MSGPDATIVCVMESHSVIVCRWRFPMHNSPCMGVITRIIIHFGPAPSRGSDVATRIEAFGLTPIIAMSNGISPFVGQNLGAQRNDRIKSGLSIAKCSRLAGALSCLPCFSLSVRMVRRCSIPALRSPRRQAST